MRACLGLADSAAALHISASSLRGARQMGRLSLHFLQRRLFTRNSAAHIHNATYSHSCSQPFGRGTKKNFWQTPQFGFTIKMSSAGLGGGLGSAGLYAVVTNPAQVGAKPEEADELKHHLKNGKGFVNPWDSFRDFNPFKLMFSMAW